LTKEGKRAPFNEGSELQCSAGFHASVCRYRPADATILGLSNPLTVTIAAIAASAIVTINRW
jgi:hypothetical protein